MIYLIPVLMLVVIHAAAIMYNSSGRHRWEFESTCHETSLSIHLSILIVMLILFAFGVIV